MTTAEASLVSAFSLGKGHFDLRIREMCAPPPAARVGLEGQQERRMRALHVASSCALPG